MGVIVEATSLEGPSPHMGRKQASLTAKRGCVSKADRPRDLEKASGSSLLGATMKHGAYLMPPQSRLSQACEPSTEISHAGSFLGSP